MKTKLVCSLFLLLSTALSVCAASSVVRQNEADAWICYVVPLPKKIVIDSKVMVNPGHISVVKPAASDMLIDQAYKELKQSIGTENQANPPQPVFTIYLQIGGAESADLHFLKNAGQAYHIIPGKDNRSLYLVATQPQGLYYAAETLQQLIKAKSSPAKAVVPILTVTDWPDMEDRGLWGSDSFEHLKWMGGLKLNINEQISARNVDKQGRGHSFPKGGHDVLFKEGVLYGIKPVPVVLHLEQASSAGMFDAYPNLKAVDSEGGAICYSQPQIADIIADWLVDLGSLPNVKEVDVWMTENLHGKGGCKCAECSKEDRSVLEARVIIAGWEKAKQKLPGLGLRILSSEETYKANGRIISELPKEVKFWYYHSQFTYMNAESPMITQELEDFARAGRWIGVCPSLTHWCEPFTSPQFVNYRMNEFVDKELAGIIAYATPRTEFGVFNVEGEAEWTWNSKGRSPHEFAASYAVRHGIKNPDKFADWAVTQGMVAWDCYGSDWPDGDKKGMPGHAAKLLRAGKLPDLGVVTYAAYRTPFADIKTVEQLDNDVAASAKAVELAKEMGIPLYIYESTIVQGYINSLKALYGLRGVITADGIAPENKAEAKKYFQMYLSSLQLSIDTIPDWEAAVRAEKNSAFSANLIELLKRMQDEMETLATDLKVDLDK